MCEEKCGEEPDLSASLLPCTSSGMKHLFEYLSYLCGFVLGKVILCCYLFAGSLSVLVMDTLVEGP